MLVELLIFFHIIRGWILILTPFFLYVTLWLKSAKERLLLLLFIIFGHVTILHSCYHVSVVYATEEQKVITWCFFEVRNEGFLGHCLLALTRDYVLSWIFLYHGDNVPECNSMFWN
jgi:hypothetical protein